MFPTLLPYAHALALSCATQPFDSPYHVQVDLEEHIAGTNFRWHEALWLPKWQVYCFPTTEQYENIVITARALQNVYLYFGKEPITITSWLRPELYNNLQPGSSPHSMHKRGGAVDFIIPNLRCDDVRGGIVGKLAEWRIRMEDNPGSNWVHIDIREPGAAGRFFRP